MALGIAPDEHWLGLFCSASQQALPNFNPQNLSNTVWALGRLRHAPPPAWGAAFLEALRAKMGSFSAVQLCDTLYGLAQLGLRPEQGLLARLLVACAGSVNVMAGALPAAASCVLLGRSGAACVLRRRLPALRRRPAPARLRAAEPLWGALPHRRPSPARPLPRLPAPAQAPSSPAWSRRACSSSTSPPSCGCASWWPRRARACS